MRSLLQIVVIGLVALALWLAFLYLSLLVVRQVYPPRRPMIFVETRRDTVPQGWPWR